MVLLTNLFVLFPFLSCRLQQVSFSPYQYAVYYRLSVCFVSLSEVHEAVRNLVVLNVAGWKKTV